MEGKEVIFSLIHQSGFTPDEQEQKDLNDMLRKRNGLCYGSTEVIENELKTFKFIVEDEETGEVFEVPPTLVKFKK